MNTARIYFLVGILLLIAVGSNAVPRLINYQGTISGPGGPLDGPHDLTFQIYADSTGGSAYWTELHTGVQFSSGLFSVTLGESAMLPDTLFNNGALYLGITVGSDDEMAPRVRLTSAPYALRAAVADTALVAAGITVHTHDDRYRTHDELGTGGTVNDDGNPVTWTRLKNVPAGFADGVDNTGSGSGGWVDDGDIVRLETATDSVGVGTTTPQARLDVRGTFHVGVDGAGHDVNFYGDLSGGRLHWNLDRNALRAGRERFNGWAPDSIGSYSIGLGHGVVASQLGSVAIGYDTQARGYYATAFGYKTLASQYYATALGKESRASGMFSFAAGDEAVATGGASLAVGSKARALGSSSIALGRNVTAGPADNTVVIGEGIDSFNPLVNDVGNSFVVGFEDTVPVFFAGGASARVGIGTRTPAEKLDVTGTVRTDGFRMPTGAVDGYVLTSDATGMGSWQQMSAGTDADSFFSIDGYPVMWASWTENTILGFGAGQNLTSGTQNTFVGDDAGALNSTGHSNVYVGEESGAANSASMFNTFVGRRTGRGGMFGSNNTFIGFEAGKYSQGDNCVYIGTGAGANVTESDRFILANGEDPTNMLIHGYFSSGEVFLDHLSASSASIDSLVTDEMTIDGDLDVLQELSVQGNASFLNNLKMYGRVTAYDSLQIRVDTSDIVKFYDDRMLVNGLLQANRLYINRISEFGPTYGVDSRCTTNSGLAYGVYGFASATGAGGSGIGVHAVGGDNSIAFKAEKRNSTNAVFLAAGAYAGRFDGDVEVNGGDLTMDGMLTTDAITITGGSDLSEHFDIAHSASVDPQPGHVVSIDPEHPGDLVVCSEPYDKKVAGVVSGAGGISTGMVMGQQGTEADGSHPVALSGRVYCWAETSSGSIEPGDLLTTSAVSGHAMKATDRERSHGTIIGKAMTALPSGRGLVLVLVNLQ